jgi:hypothetical protein
MRFRAAAPFLAVAAVVALAYVRPIALGETFCGRDHLTWTIPSRAAVAEAFAHGRIPEWWDRIGLGTPLAANPAHEVAYPPAWSLALTGGARGADALAIAHILWAGIGLLLFARRLGATPAAAAALAAALCTSGYVASVVVDGIPVMTLAWTPWLAFAADRFAHTPSLREGALTALVAGAQILSGDPAGVVTSVLVAVAIVVGRAERPLPALGRLGLALVGAGLVAAVALLPALLLLRESERAGGLGGSSAQLWSMHPLRTVEWIWPRLLGDPADPARDLARRLANTGGGELEPSWAMSLHIGAPVVFLVVFASAGDQRLRRLAIASAILVVLALGRYTPLHALWRFVFPPERLIRYPEKHLAGALVLWCALAAVGLSRELPRRWKIACLAAAALILLADGVLLLLHAPSEALVGGLVAAAALAALVVRRLAPVAVVLPLVAHTLILQPMIPRALLAQAPALLTRASPGRLYRPRELSVVAAGASPADLAIAARETAAENTAAPYGFAHVPGYDPTHAARFHRLWDAAARHGGRILQLFDVEWAILPAGTRAPMQPIATTARHDVVLGRVESRRSRAFVTTRWRWPASDDEATAALLAPSDEIQLAGTGPAPTNAASITPCSVSSDRPERVELGCDSASGGYAVLLDAWAPGWSASVDGADAPIVRADVVVRAVPIPPGAHTVVFRYRTPGLRGGALISLCALALAVMALRRRSAP